MTDTLHIAVAGASGATGRLAVERAAAAGHRVTALVRPASDYAAPPGVAVHRVEVVTDPDWELPADVDAVISALGKQSYTDPVPVCADGTANLIAAMRRGDVRRLLVVSASPVLTTGAGEPWWFRTFVRPAVARSGRALYADLTAMEETVRSSGTDWTIIRPGRLLDRPATDYRLTPEANATTSVHRVDLADALVRLVGDASTVRRSYGLACGRRARPQHTGSAAAPLAPITGGRS
ncbi:MAG: NAD(P)-dependent oxidoreductase [Propionibacteriaceae bacterium]